MAQWINRKLTERRQAMEANRLDETERQRRVAEHELQKRLDAHRREEERIQQAATGQAADMREFRALTDALASRVGPAFDGFSRVMIESATWAAFEELIAELYRAEGWTAWVTNAGPDSGVDVQLERGSQRGLVQVKHRPDHGVSPHVVQAIYGEARARDYNYAAVITSGRFTRQARGFAARTSTNEFLVELLDGSQLLNRIRRLPIEQQRQAAAPLLAKSPGRDPGAVAALRQLGKVFDPPTCSQHGPMKLVFQSDRTAYWWSCWHWPTCREAVPPTQYYPAIKAGAHVVHVFGRRRDAAQLERRHRKAMNNRGHSPYSSSRSSYPYGRR
jgi:hypothetical protein